VRVSYSVDGPVARLTISNPGRGNALSPSMMLQLADGLREAEVSGARVAVVAGAPGRAFCSGYDLAKLPSGPGEGTWNERFPELTAMLAALDRFTGVLIAEVSGHAIGGGALLAAGCDFRVAQSGATFRIPATRLGVMYPLEGIQRLVALIGLGRATDVLLTGRAVSAEEAVAWGLYREVVEPDPLPGRVRALAEDLSERAPLAVRGLRAVLRADGVVATDRVRALHSEWTGRCIGSRDLVEGLDAARERRPPRFEGR